MSGSSRRKNHTGRNSLPSSFALKLNPPPSFLHDFFPTFDRADQSRAALGFSLSDNGITPAGAFVLYDREGILPEGGKQGTLFFSERIHYNAAMVVLLNELGTVGTAG